MVKSWLDNCDKRLSWLDILITEQELGWKTGRLTIIVRMLSFPAASVTWSDASIVDIPYNSIVER